MEYTVNKVTVFIFTVINLLFISSNFQYLTEKAHLRAFSI